MIAVIKTGGKQYKVQEGDVIKIETLNLEPKKDKAQEVQFDDILNDKKVIAEIIETGKGKKVMVQKFHKRKRYTRNVGHRQNYLQIKIKSIK